MATPPPVLDFKDKALDGGFLYVTQSWKRTRCFEQNKVEELCLQEVILPTTGRLGGFLDIVHEGQTTRENPKHHCCLSSERTRGRRGWLKSPSRVQLEENKGPKIGVLGWRVKRSEWQRGAGESSWVGLEESPFWFRESVHAVLQGPRNAAPRCQWDCGSFEGNLLDLCTPCSLCIAWIYGK